MEVMHMYPTNIYSLFGAFFGGALLLLTAACTPGAGVAPEAELAGTEWVLVRYGPTAAPVEPLADNPPTLSFDDDTLGGNTGCNHYGGEYQVEGNRLVINEIFQTLIGCPEPLMEQEGAYLGALRAADTFTLTGGSLTLFYEDGELHFQRRQPPEDAALEQTNWQLTTFVSNETARSLLADSEIRATFQNGTIRGHGGCNQFQGDYDRNGNRMHMGGMIVTDLHCGDEALMAQEEEFLSALRAVERFEIDGPQLSLHHPGGTLIFSAR
jgi:heat shock protein HslJ